MVEDENGEYHSVTLDGVIPREEKITFIKLDVEGDEVSALRGGINHIEHDSPDLVVCLYHKPEDIREIISFVNETNPNYRLYMRHYSDKQKETVLYATIH